jgi:hypothetical protein
VNLSATGFLDSDVSVHDQRPLGVDHLAEDVDLDVRELVGLEKDHAVLAVTPPVEGGLVVGSGYQSGGLAGRLGVADPIQHRFVDVRVRRIREMCAGDVPEKSLITVITRITAVGTDTAGTVATGFVAGVTVSPGHVVLAVARSFVRLPVERGQHVRGEASAADTLEDAGVDPGGCDLGLSVVCLDSERLYRPVHRETHAEM